MLYQLIITYLNKNRLGCKEIYIGILGFLAYFFAEIKTIYVRKTGKKIKLKYVEKM